MDMEEKVCFGDVEEILDEVEIKFRRLKKFDILLCPPWDHHFRFNEILPTKSLAETLLIKQEWKILEKNLPNWIFVRAYDFRVNLMRAAISGLEGTPYRYGLFFFDIFIPSDYPSEPPKVFYHSFGHSLNNPKLRQDGRVSLPILEESSWVLRRFNIPEILRFIQYSVLNYDEYNLSGHQINKLKEPSEKEKRKARLTFMQTCEAMLSILEKPPRDFQDFVKGYFRKWAHRVLLCYKEEILRKERHTKSAMDDLQLFLKLLKAFEANGTYCRHHYDLKTISILYNDKEGLKDQRDRRKTGTILETVGNMFKYMW